MTYHIIDPLDAEERRLRSNLRNHGAIVRDPVAHVSHSVVHLGGVVEPGNFGSFVVRPQVPFRGRWFFTHDADALLWVEDLRVGNVCLIPSYSSIPASFWNADAYEKIFRELCPVLSSEQFKNHPLVERLRLDFPTCSPGIEIRAIVVNRGTKALTFKGRIAGDALYTDHSGPVEFVDTRLARLPDPVPIANRKKPEALAIPVAPVSGARELARRCWYCSAGPDEPCHGLPLGQAHGWRTQ